MFLLVAGCHHDDFPEIVNLLCDVDPHASPHGEPTKLTGTCAYDDGLDFDVGSLQVEVFLPATVAVEENCSGVCDQSPPDLTFDLDVVPVDSNPDAPSEVSFSLSFTVPDPGLYYMLFEPEDPAPDVVVIPGMALLRAD